MKILYIPYLSIIQKIIYVKSPVHLLSLSYDDKLHALKVKRYMILRYAAYTLHTPKRSKSIRKRMMLKNVTDFKYYLALSFLSLFGFPARTIEFIEKFKFQASVLKRYI